MKNLLHIPILGLSLIVFSCTFNNSKPPFLPVDENEVIFRKGDCLLFDIDSLNKGVAILTGYRKYPNSLWYGLLFTNYLDSIPPDTTKIKELKIFGRKVQSSFEKTGFYIGLDYDYLLDSCLKANAFKFRKIWNVNLNDKMLRLGSEGATSDFNKLIESFQYGLKKRLSPPDDYRDHIKKLDKFRPDEYFLLEDFILKD